jgi:hypothetical protein
LTKAGREKCLLMRIDFGSRATASQSGNPIFASRRE